MEHKTPIIQQKLHSQITAISDEQRKLWKSFIATGIFTGVYTFLTLVVDIRLGFTQAYFEQTAKTGQAAALIHLESVADYALIALAIPFVFLLRLMLGSLTMILMRQIFIPPSENLATQFHQLCVIGAVCAALGITGAYTAILMYSNDADRHIFVMFIKVGNLLFALMLQMGLAIVLYVIYRHRLIPRTVTLVSAGILLMAMIYSPIATHPEFTQFFSSLITYIASMILVFYLILVLQSAGKIADK